MEHRAAPDVTCRITAMQLHSAYLLELCPKQRRERRIMDPKQRLLTLLTHTSPRSEGDWAAGFPNTHSYPISN